MTYVLDTNIITAVLKDNEKVIQRAQRLVLEGKEILINGISYYEIKRGLLAVNATNQLRKFKLLFMEFGLVLLDTQNIFDIASKIYAELRQKGQLIEDADILIASIVLCKNFILVTDDAHFDRIENLKKENWLR